MGGKRRHWTNREHEMVVAMLDSGRRLREIAAATGRSFGSVRGYTVRRGLKKRHAHHDVLELLSDGSSRSITDMALDCGRTWAAIKFACIRLEKCGAITREMVNGTCFYRRTM